MCLVKVLKSYYLHKHQCILGNIYCPVVGHSERQYEEEKDGWNRFQVQPKREREREGGRKGGRERASERQKSQKSWRISCEKSRQSRWNSWRSHRTHSEDSETHCKLDGRDDESRTLRFEEVKLSLSGDCFSGCIPAHVCKFSLPLPSLSLPSILHPRASMILPFVSDKRWVLDTRTFDVF